MVPVEFENSVAYYMVNANGVPTRNVDQSVRWGDVTGKELLWKSLFNMRFVLTRAGVRCKLTLATCPS